jgi:hypothetical protein
MEQRAGTADLPSGACRHRHPDDGRAAYNTQLMAATINGAATSKTGHSRNIRR